MTPFRLLTATGTLGLIIWVLITPQIPLAALLLLIPLIPLQIVISQSASQCTECGISVSDPAFNNPERELPFKFDYSKIGNDWASGNYRRKLGGCRCVRLVRSRSGKVAGDTHDTYSAVRKSVFLQILIYHQRNVYSKFE
ncbi:hypothetical protein [Thalassolituus hydrocarboniclasticus]|uniref:Uncharacterized protein n=1 Tax=Thalassolituus hydrocarboniclasticus TaxID=2742796 RepID=A0ABY6A8F6_9GAMM|nr:hypothetical protein [Thalassolituus hydrocarboniclasticus]UXD87217.1 hypothetical protein HUF19_07145 [Thalassolituus hydrocarboniclasticus]